MANRQRQIVNLHDGWSLRQSDTAEWLPVRSVPTNVHLDLMENQRIDDPFIDFNELKCQWVAEKTWIYKRALPRKPGSSDKCVLAFDGLDTFATVTIDGAVVLTSDNMWHTHRVDVTEFLKHDREIVLKIEFKPAMIEARRIKDAHPEHRWVGFNGDMSRLAVRKAQYHWGWDWGPVLSPCGPCGEVRLECYSSRLEDLRVTYDVDDTLTKVRGALSVCIDGADGQAVEFSIALGDTEVFTKTVQVGADKVATAEFAIDGVELWFPHGYGKQSLYTVTASLSHGGSVLDVSSKRTGFRKGELVQEPDHIGASFYFRFNGIDVFCGGSDWIPADSFTPRITPERYRAWLQTMVDGNQIMIRVWGGGIWEHDAFYDVCDELGILVWQDFMFGCGNYPAFPEILASIERECVTQTKRLRHHPALAIYAGNNEDYQVQEQYHLTYDYEDKNPDNWLKTDFPARYIYEKLLPDVVKAHTGHVPYHPGSPWGGGKISSDPTVGDMHQWNVWHGTQEKYQIFDTLGGRFNSEFGMEAFPHIATIEHFVTDPSQRFPQSHVLDFHNKADGHERRIATYLAENFRIKSYDLQSYIHLTQLSQSDALMYGYRGWRRQWGQKGRVCGGALVWQLNDCWPTTSWAIIDYFQRKKPAYYALRRVLAPVAVAVERDHHDWSVVHAKPAGKLNFECWIVSSRTEDITNGKVELRFISVTSGKEIKDKITHEGITIKANGTTDVLEGVIDNMVEEAHVLSARLWIGDELVARDVDWPQPFKYLDMSDRGVEVQFHAAKNGKPAGAVVKAAKPTKGFVFEEREGVLMDDGALDLTPGDEQEVVIQGLKEGAEPLQWTYLDAPVAREQ